MIVDEVVEGVVDGALRIKTARAFTPLVGPMRFKGAWGGRGSGKSHFFAGEVIRRSVQDRDAGGFRCVCIREVQKSLAQSVRQLIVDKINSLGLGQDFEVLEAEIRTPGGGLVVFQGMQNHTAHSIKSLEGFDVAWVEEAQSLSQKSLDLLRPTIRKPGSELWFSWNPEHEHDPVDKFLRKSPPANARVVRANYADNPWITQELLDEAEIDKASPDKYAHVWLGEYARAVEGAYYADDLRRAEDTGRVTSLMLDPILPLKAAWDLGISDATAIWVAQFVGQEIRFVDYIEGSGQPLAYYLNALRARGYDNALCILPHDGAHPDTVSATRFEDHIRQAGFSTQLVKNQGKGAAMKRIEAARRWFPRMKFDVEKTLAGRKALASYHERFDVDRQVGLGPEHDWASHAADAFGLMASVYQPPSTAIMPKPKNAYVI
jgi:phage terminase large subunit